MGSQVKGHTQTLQPSSPNPQYPGRQWLQVVPPTPGLQWHCPLLGWHHGVSLLVDTEPTRSHQHPTVEIKQKSLTYIEHYYAELQMKELTFLTWQLSLNCIYFPFRLSYVCKHAASWGVGQGGGGIQDNSAGTGGPRCYAGSYHRRPHYCPLWTTTLAARSGSSLHGHYTHILKKKKEKKEADIVSGTCEAQDR